jgi:hypothetical protein
LAEGAAGTVLYIVGFRVSGGVGKGLGVAGALTLSTISTDEHAPVTLEDELGRGLPTRVPLMIWVSADPTYRSIPNLFSSTFAMYSISPGSGVYKGIRQSRLSPPTDLDDLTVTSLDVHVAG